jgi:hypothetical protein
MFLLHGDAKYVDVLERTLYNGFLSGVSLSGDHFFYPNPLVSRGGYARSEWFGCACCPVNVSRFLPSMPGLVYAGRGDQLYVNLYAAGVAETEVAQTKITFKQETRYPWEGAVKLTVQPAKPAAFTLRMRIPGWARNEPLPTDLYHYADMEKPVVTLAVNGKKQTVKLEKGYAIVTRTWKQGDVVSLELAMPVRRVAANPQVKDDAGRVAIERGPLVYSVEGVDHGGKVFQLILPDTAKLSAKSQPELLGGVSVITGQGQMARRAATGATLTETAAITAVPYYAWCNRGAGQMEVWLPRTPELAKPLPVPTLASQSTVTASHVHGADSVEAINDGLEPKNSNDGSIPRMTWWEHKGTTEWVQYDLAKPAKVNAVEVYWFDDGASNGGCRIPAQCQVLWLDGGSWKPVENQSAGGCEKDRFNRITFAPITTKSLRLQVKLQNNYSGGILEWKVAGAGE